MAKGKEAVREIKEKTVRATEARRFERIDLAASSRGISTALLRKLINNGQLTRYKLGTATMIDASELEKLIVADIGNRGPAFAPQAAK
jgi:hypothetical protein